MKEVVFTNKETEIVYFDDIKDNDIVGFIDEHGNKGFVSHIGGAANQNEYQPISFKESERVPNKSYGTKIGYLSVKSALRPECAVEIQKAYVFSDLKSLLKWLAE